MQGMTDGLMKTGREANKIILSVKKYLIIMSLFMTMHEGEDCVNTYNRFLVYAETFFPFHSFRMFKANNYSC